MKTLIKKIFINGKIKTLTGLHVGGNNTHLDIGGVNNFVIRNPKNNQPYIPGSSLKGKMRSLLEQSYGIFGTGMGEDFYGPTDNPDDDTTKVFGSVKGQNSNKKDSQGKEIVKKNIPSRIIVRDSSILSHDYDNTTDLPYTEIKTEVVINRITAQATPRQIERVPADVEFTLNIVINIWSDDEYLIELPEAQIVQMLFNGMRLIEDDYLGGNGSRGSGQIKIGIEEIKERNNTFYQDMTVGNTIDYQDSEHQIPEDLKL